MSRSVKVHPDRKQQVISALESNRFLTQGYLAAHLEIALSTVNKFINGKPVYISKFEEICEALGLDKREMLEPVNSDSDTLPEESVPPQGFYAYDDAWVGREQLVAELSQKLRGSFRITLLLGLTGIGKTALAERLAVELEGWFDKDWKNKVRRVEFDYKEKAEDCAFASVAEQWLEQWNIKISLEDKKPERLLQRLVKHLRENKVLVLIDSMERLLTGDAKTGWGNFVDEFWKKFFLDLLSPDSSCMSRLIITSQDCPSMLFSGDRRPNFLHPQLVEGLTESEQIALFETIGLDVTKESYDKPILLRIGKVYNGHPLALRTIIGEIDSKPFFGYVQAYWNNYQAEIEVVEKALEEAKKQEKIEGKDDPWKLDRYTNALQLAVQERLEKTFERLKNNVYDAYVLICAASVYRIPVQQEGWLMQLADLVEYLEEQECSQKRQENALNELRNRYLVEESLNHNNKLVLGQHNLVRSVSLEHNRKLLKTMSES